jgi:nitrite reductase/ring-hydroxylating ferredoxin subunit
MDRKEFLKASCKLCLIGAAGMAFPAALTSCSSSKALSFRPEVVDGTIAIPLNLLDGDGQQTVRPKGWEYDLYVQREADGSYKALLLRCTHMENGLYRTDAGWACNLHGSSFDANGKVAKGPAQKPLKKYKTAVKGENLIVFV